MLKVVSAAYYVGNQRKVAVLGYDTEAQKQFTFIFEGKLMVSKLEGLREQYAERSYNDVKDVQFYTQLIGRFEKKPVSRVVLLQSKYDVEELREFVATMNMPKPSTACKIKAGINTASEFVDLAQKIANAISRVSPVSAGGDAGSSGGAPAKKKGQRVSVSIDSKSFNAVFSAGENSFVLGKGSDGKLQLEVVKETPLSLEILGLVARSVGLG